MKTHLTVKTAKDFYHALDQRQNVRVEFGQDVSLEWSDEGLIVEWEGGERYPFPGPFKEVHFHWTIFKFFEELQSHLREGGRAEFYRR